MMVTVVTCFPFPRQMFLDHLDVQLFSMFLVMV